MCVCVGSSSVRTDSPCPRECWGNSHSRKKLGHVKIGVCPGASWTLQIMLWLRSTGKGWGVSRGTGRDIVTAPTPQCSQQMFFWIAVKCYPCGKMEYSALWEIGPNKTKVSMCLFTHFTGDVILTLILKPQDYQTEQSVKAPWLLWQCEVAEILRVFNCQWILKCSKCTCWG